MEGKKNGETKRVEGHQTEKNEKCCYTDEDGGPNEDRYFERISESSSDFTAKEGSTKEGSTKEGSTKEGSTKEESACPGRLRKGEGG